MKKILIYIAYSLYALHAFGQKDNLNSLKVNGLKGKIKKFTKYQYEPLASENNIQQFILDKQHLVTKSVVYFGLDGIETKQLMYIKTVNNVHAFSCISTHNVINDKKILIVHNWNRPQMNSDLQNEVDSVMLSWQDDFDCVVETKSSIWGDHTLNPMLFVDTVALDYSMNITKLKTAVIDLYGGRRGSYKRAEYLTKYSYDSGKLFLLYNTSPYIYGKPDEKSYHIANVKYDKHGNMTEYTAFVSINLNNHILRIMKFEYEYY